MDNIVTIIVTFLISGVIFVPIGVIIRKKIAESKISGAEAEAKRLVDLANKEAENIRKEMQVYKSKVEAIIKSQLDLLKEI